jgi:hypothetical protein
MIATSDLKVYPLSIRDVSPGDGAVRLTGTHPSGIPDGIHTGGAWLLGNEVWKPLDGRPFSNSECQVQTREDEVLALMAGEPLFPRNWRVEERHGRRFLVRQKALIIPRDVPYSDLNKEHMLLVESGMRALNARGWETGEELGVAFDQDSCELFCTTSALLTTSVSNGCPPATRSGAP